MSEERAYMESSPELAERYAKLLRPILIACSEFTMKCACFTQGDDTFLTIDYDRPVVSLDLLQRIREAVGGEDIFTGPGDEPGCDTCDYGSRYGIVITVINPKKLGEP